MSKINFPDEKVERAVLDLSKELSLNILDVVCSAKEGQQIWKWILTRPNSHVRISLSMRYPSYLTFLSFSNVDDKLKDNVSSYFDFGDYLEKYLKSFEEANRLNAIAVDKAWKDEWSTVIELFRNHAKTDMAEILNGKEWPNIEFNMWDYMDTEAADRMYEDQVKMIEEAKGKKGWLHIINFKKKK